MSCKRKPLDLGQKASIVFDIQSGKSQVQVCKDKKLSTSTVNNIWKQREKILEDHLKLDPNVKKRRPSEYPEIDRRLLEWLDLQRNRNVPLNGVLCLAEAKKIAESLGETNFKASEGWLSNWKKPHGISFQIISGEAAAVDDSVVSNWMQNIWPRFKTEFKPEDIYNCDETALFYKLLPNKTLHRKGQVCTGGKLSKERITVMLATNATGTEKLKPVVIGRSENPRCFKNVKKTSLPVDYYFNKNAWMTQAIFAQWIKKLDLRMRFRRRKILLLVDNCSGHKIHEKTPNVKILFLPPNVTAKLQPLDLGIISATKSYYRSSLVRKLIDRIDNGQEFLIDILDGIKELSLAWNKVSATTIQNCFKKSKLISSEIDSDVEMIEEGIADEDWSRVAPIQISFDDFLLADNQVITSDALDQNCPETLDSEVDDGEDDPDIERNLISTRRAQVHVEELKTWYLAQGTDHPDFWMNIACLEEFMVKQHESTMKQPSIRKYFKPQTPSV